MGPSWPQTGTSLGPEPDPEPAQNPTRNPAWNWNKNWNWRQNRRNLEPKPTRNQPGTRGLTQNWNGNQLQLELEPKLELELGPEPELPNRTGTTTRTRAGTVPEPNRLGTCQKRTELYLLLCIYSSLRRCIRINPIYDISLQHGSPCPGLPGCGGVPPIPPRPAPQPSLLFDSPLILSLCIYYVKYNSIQYIKL